VSLASGAGVAKALRSLDADVLEVDVNGPDFVVPAGTEVAFNVIHGTFRRGRPAPAPSRGARRPLHR